MSVQRSRSDTVAELPVERLVELMGHGQVQPAIELVLGQVEDGMPADRVIRELLAPAQAEVGERWYRGQWTSSREHVATAVADVALHQVASASLAPATGAGRLAVACAPGDWHTFPCRMAAELLRLSGWQVEFLGGSLPSWHLSRWIVDERPDGVVLTATACTGLRGILTVASAAGEAAVPIVAGGVGLGPDSRRADALGVRWCGALPALAQVLDAPAPEVDGEELAGRVREHDTGLLCRADLVQSIVAQTGSELADDAGQLVNFLFAAVLTGDNRVLGNYLAWWTGLRSRRGSDPEAVRAAMRALAGALPDSMPSAQQLAQTSC